MHLQRVQCIFLALFHLGHQLMSQLTTSGQMYELISGKDTEDYPPSVEKYTAYFECGEDDTCGYVAEEKSGGIFVKEKFGKAMNESKYSAIWKKRISDINECLSSPCPAGTCVDRINGYQCVCRSGYYGAKCDKDINECASNPCVNGTCVDKVNAYGCVCSSGYSGQTCNIDINECASSPCVNGTCVDKVNGYECICSIGFSGQTCNIDTNECASNPCLNGTCVDKVNGYECICSNGFSGQTCNIDINECASNPCVNGTCVDKVNAYDCVCSSGYSGQTCNIDIDECASSPCVNGTCFDKINGYECLCSSGYSGQTCNIDTNECASSPCVNGTCVDKVNGYECMCSSGYSGITCNIDINECASNPCVNGTCVDKANGYQCVCSSGYSGHNCSIDINECASNPCNLGICVDKVNAYQCFCNGGYYGVRCDKINRSCLDVYRQGARKNGNYSIYGVSDLAVIVYCDFESEANSSWTLVTSYELANKVTFRDPYSEDYQKNSRPDWKYYRLRKGDMQSIQSYTTLWRITCDFQTSLVDYRDYIRGKKEELDIITFYGWGLCRKVEYVNVRGHNCSQCTVPFYQVASHDLHVDSKYTGCEFQASSGAVYSEDNFGCYIEVNSAFRCSRNSSSTTQIWFGDYV